jgi:predicted dehydrogenase
LSDERPLATVPVLILGAGTMARIHAEALASIPGVTIAGIVNARAASAKRLASEVGTRAFASFDRALHATKARAAIVCLPTPLHRAAVVEAARAGLDVLCEKPIARSVRDAEAMIRACAEHRVVFMVAHVLRFFPEYAKLRALVTKGEIGTPRAARLSRGGAGPRGARGWYARTSESGGVLVDLVIHDFDWLRWTFGPVKRVRARHAGPRGKLASHAHAVLRHESGVSSHVEGYWRPELPFRTTALLAGSRGAIEYDSARASIEIENPYVLQDRAFIDCVRSRSTPDPTPEDALEALRISLACLASARTGKVARP